MELAKEQEEGIKYFLNNYKKQKIITIIGPAGTGKTLIAGEIAKRLKIRKEFIAYCAYTGCAALMLKRKGLNATTIHQLIYITKKKENGEFTTFLRKELEFPYKVIVIDEGSFLNEKILKDLQSFGIPILLLGDPYQLGPIEGLMNDYIKNPDVVLKTIFRQKEGSDIITFADNLRNNINNFTIFTDEVKCIRKNQVSTETLLCADQILCCTNAVRNGINKTLREHFGYNEKFPMVGEKIICLKNNWNNFPFTTGGQKNKDYELVNGMTGFIEEIKDISLEKNKYIMKAVFALEFDRKIKYIVNIDLNPFFDLPPFRDNKEEFRDSFDFGYAITIHKSQGNQWDKVLVYSNNAFGEKSRLYYTASTRAAKCLVWVS